MNRIENKWTDEQVRLLCHLYAQDKLFREIAKEIGKSSHAVAHKLRRIIPFEQRRGAMNPNPWTERKIKELTHLWEVEGMTATQISARMGFTRNAIIGKARRLNLVHPRSPKRVANLREANKARAAAVRRVRGRRAGVNVAKRMAQTDKAIGLEPLGTSEIPENGCCRYISGETPNYRYCARMATEGQYCAEHYALMRIPA